MALLRFLTRAVETWAALQVKLQGTYSVNRLVAFKKYQMQSSGFREAIALFSSLVPCLMVIITIDIPRLARPGDGLASSHVLWGRAFVSTGLIVFTLLQQMRTLLPDLGIRQVQIIIITLMVAACSTVWAFGLAHHIGYPLPFTFAAGSPVFMAILILSVWSLWGKTLYHSPRLQQQLKQYLLLVVVQWALTLIYPILNFVFLKVDAIGQTALALLFPVVKMIMKLCLAGLLDDLSDLRPELIIFNVEVFHSLFMACCMQNALSIWTTVAIIAMDAARAWVSIRSVKHRLEKLHAVGIPRTATDSQSEPRPPLVDSVIYLLRCPGILQLVTNNSGFSSIRVSRVASRTVTSLHSASILPAPITLLGKPLSAFDSAPPHELLLLSELSVQLSDSQSQALRELNPSQQVAYVQDVLALLYTTEFLLLVEYIEVIIPVIYFVYLVVIYHLPNRIYYPQLRAMDGTRLVQVVQNVLLYAGLELLSFLVMDRVLRGKVQFRPIQQLTFVLQMQWHTVQAKLILWLVYMVQASLVHFGVDYTFQFQWLHNSTYFD